MSNKLYIIGVGPGARELVHPAAMKLIECSDVLIGGRRNLEIFEELDKEKITIGNNLEEVCKYISENIQSKKIAVLATGDTGLYSIMEFLKAKLADIEIEAVPGISSMQYLCAKLKLSWHDICITSLHGHENSDLLSKIDISKNMVIFTGGKYTPDRICKEFADSGLKNVIVSVGEKLSYPDERIVSGTLEEIASMKFDDLSIMVVQNNSIIALGEPSTGWEYTTHGIPDDMFIRGEVPMTKEEVRSVSLSKLRLKEDSIVYDIGAGTGSVSIECALRCKKGMVFAIDKNKEAVKLVVKNAQKFKLPNIKAIEGMAPSGLKGLPEPDRVFIGGSCGQLDDILGWISVIGRAVRVVINTVTIESTYQAIDNLEKKGFNDIEITNIAVSRSKTVGGKHLMQALNPVYVIAATKGDRECQANYMVWV
jgi:precorrin-6Y C5,15-methyltransferase (decarboxylating)